MRKKGSEQTRLSDDEMSRLFRAIHARLNLMEAKQSNAMCPPGATMGEHARRWWARIQNERMWLDAYREFADVLAKDKVYVDPRGDTDPLVVSLVYPGALPPRPVPGRRRMPIGSVSAQSVSLGPRFVPDTAPDANVTQVDDDTDDSSSDPLMEDVIQDCLSGYGICLDEGIVQYEVDRLR